MPVFPRLLILIGANTILKPFFKKERDQRHHKEVWRMQVAVAIMGAAALAIVVVLVLMRKRIGELNAASWLVVLGAFILLSEHPQFAIAYGAQSLYPESQGLVLFPHARIHFIMSGIYAIIGLGLLVWTGRTFLWAGSKHAWYMLLAALLIGGGLDLFLGGSLYQHGSPLYALLGIQEREGFGSCHFISADLSLLPTEKLAKEPPECGRC